MATSKTSDPLTLLPSELILRILEFCPNSSLASLTRLNRAWNGFIDEIHQEAIYSLPGRSQHQPHSLLAGNGAKDPDCIERLSPTFSRYFSNVNSSKDLCRRETLLRKNWDCATPVTRETVIQVGTDPIWRFRPDFTRRWILSTDQHAGGLNVTDMDSGELLWRKDDVRTHAHLEYCEIGGCAVWDNGDVLEVWRVKSGGKRGEFERVEILRHEVEGRMVQVRGFQLRSFDGDEGTLCVVSSEGVGFVYGNVCEGEVELLRTIEIEPGAVGHLDQGEDVVVYSMGSEGYHFYEKATGNMLGVLDPALREEEEKEVFHVTHPKIRRRTFKSTGLARQEGGPSRRHTTPLKVLKGQLPDDDDDDGWQVTDPRGWRPFPRGGRIPLEEDDWGAGMLCGSLFVGVSRGGRALVCSDWRKSLDPSPDAPNENSLQIIECDMGDTDHTHFDLGGWLSVKKDRIMFEVQYSVYVIGLTNESRVQAGSARPSFALSTGSLHIPQPVSFMGLYEDCLMMTYTIPMTLQELPDDQVAGLDPGANLELQTCAIRAVSFAPDVDGVEEIEDEDDDEEEDEEEEMRLALGARNVRRLLLQQQGAQLHLIPGAEDLLDMILLNGQ